MNFFKDIVDFDLTENCELYNLTDDFFGLVIYKKLLNDCRNILVVTNSLFEANKLYTSISSYTDKVFLFPMDEFLTSEAAASSFDLTVNRLDTLNSIINNDCSIVITNLMGYLRFLPLKEDYKNSFININCGDIINPHALASKLDTLGYRREPIVNKTGEYALRGYIIDIYLFGDNNPVRLEFFDDELESIRVFDEETQKSIKEINNITIKPYTEFLVFNDLLDEHFGKQKYLPQYTAVNNIESYLKNALVCFKDFNQLEVSYAKLQEDMFTYKSERDSLFSGEYVFDFYQILPEKAIYYNSLNNYSIGSATKNMDCGVISINKFSENMDLIYSFVTKEIGLGKTIIVLLKKYQIKNLINKFKDFGCETNVLEIFKNKVNFIDLELPSGFIYKDFVILTSHELFNFSDSKKKYFNKYKYATVIKDYSKLDIGDYIVHNVHGIGIYNGVKTLSMNNITKDYLELLYQNNDKIYIPVEKIDLINKYSGREGVLPKINKLGDNEWQKVKQRVKGKVADMADKLLRIYAEREMRKGFAFSKDSDWLLEFESNFPYQLTADQKKAIIQIKEDMESPIPMDRLLCGDVGFGKTEVAFVAAFKAILDSKQVIFLCPTTILSKQHYDNALKRFSGFPVSIALLNRFTTPKEVQRIISGLKEGVIDMVIGTHRLLSDDIELKDLGLLIIDEEQRFGVAHKEKIKEYKTNVDVLTLTATPIPRTLQMSLVGIRSLSLIETPPVNRYPVQTYVLEESSQILRDAIYKELSRSGQVFILYNRVHTIEEFANRIERIAPDARICVAHGQMSKIQLENAIYDFVNYNYDILICTTIIETGIDIPNANTLIIIDADHFGLSQLYQIRGRVGRSDKFAYAYLMYQPFKMLNDAAMKRLNAIKEFTELGSGFKIAARDLSIRGAGDILGSEQAGFIDAIGVDLYLKFLNDEVARRKGEIIEEEVDSKPLLEVSTHIDDKYVYDDDIKIEIHKMINNVYDSASFENIKGELEDRFGKLPDDLIIYMYEEWFEKLAAKLKIANVRQTRNSIELVIEENVFSKFDIDEVFYDAYNISNMFRFASKNNKLIIALDLVKLEKHPIVYLISLLNQIDSKYGNTID